MTPSSQIESIAGIPRQLFYDRDGTDQLLGLHQEIARKFGVERPYFDYTDQGTTLYVDQLLDDGVRLQIGQIGSFSRDTMARVYNEQAILYVLRNTMGPHYPENHKPTNIQLVAEMIGGVSADRLIVLLGKSTAKGDAPLASVQAYSGTSETTLADGLRGDENEVKLTLATFQALRATEMGIQSAAFNDFIRRYGQVRENQAMGMSRLFNRTPNEAKLMEVKNSNQAWTAMSALVVGVHLMAEKGSTTLPKLYMYDTTESIQTRLAALFGMEMILKNGFLKPRKDVRKGVLKYHYGGDGVGESLLGDLVVGIARDEEYFHNAVSYLREMQGIVAMNWFEKEAVVE